MIINQYKNLTKRKPFIVSSLINIMPVNITTAVDSLVELVNNKKRISLEEVAKELGLPENIINEWAQFLEEENILTVEYQFTTPFLVVKSKGLSEEDFSRDIEILSRELEVMLAYLNKIQIKHDLKIKNVNDIRKLVRKNVKLDKNVLFAQRFVLEYQINELLKKVSRLKSYKKSDFDKIDSEYNVIKKRKNIFDRNFIKL